MILDQQADASVEPPARAETRDMPAHALALPGTDWQLWRDFLVRGTGFPIALVLRLSSDEAARAADRLCEARDEVTRCHGAALDAVRRAFDAADPGARGALLKRRRNIFRGRVAIGAGSDDEDALARAIEARNAAQAAYRAAFDSAAAAAEHEIGRLASEPLFREAILWQNHRAARRSADALIAGQGNRHRRAMELVAMRLQRYTVKNDSIGFFGPIGWGRLSEGPSIVEVAPGPGLIDRRGIAFEGWCVDALADRFNEDAALRRWIPPQVMTGVWTDAAAAYAPGVGAVAVTPLQRRVLDLCDGRRTAGEIAIALSDPPDAASSEAAVIAALAELVDLHLIVWRLEVGSQRRPELALDAHIAAIGDPDRRASCAAALAELVAARDRVGRAAGHPDDLEAALTGLDATFVRLTGREPERRAGMTYGARGLVYEDCHRDCGVVLGQSFLSRLALPLSLVLQAAEWATVEVARGARQILRRLHAELRDARGEAVIDAHVFYEEVRRTGSRRMPALFGEVQRRIQQAWQAILEVDEASSRVTRASADLAPRVRQAFPVRARAWSRAHYISPDIMVAADGLDAFRRGEFHGVLGEVHVTNSLVASSFVSQHPNPRSLVDAMAHDTAGLTLASARKPKDEWLARTAMVVHSPAAWQYQFGPDPPDVIACGSAPAGKFVAIDNGETVVMRARDGSVEFDALELFAMRVSQETDRIVGTYLPRAAHRPRITIDNLTIARERWYVQPAGMPFLAERDPARQFAALRAWAREHGMPRRVFYRTPAELKPCHLDFNSPLYSALFVKLIRQVGTDAEVRIEEMLPDLTEAWLVDAEGRRYGCEIRLAASRGRRPARSASPP